jgi:hypothetical protein
MFTAILVVLLVYTFLVVWFVHAVRRAPYLDGGQMQDSVRARLSPTDHPGEAPRDPSPWKSPPLSRGRGATPGSPAPSAPPRPTDSRDS